MCCSSVHQCKPNFLVLCSCMLSCPSCCMDKESLYHGKCIDEGINLVDCSVVDTSSSLQQDGEAHRGIDAQTEAEVEHALNNN